MPATQDWFYCVHLVCSPRRAFGLNCPLTSQGTLPVSARGSFKAWRWARRMFFTSKSFLVSSKLHIEIPINSVEVLRTTGWAYSKLSVNMLKPPKPLIRRRSSLSWIKYFYACKSAVSQSVSCEVPRPGQLIVVAKVIHSPWPLAFEDPFVPFCTCPLRLPFHQNPITKLYSVKPKCSCRADNSLPPAALPPFFLLHVSCPPHSVIRLVYQLALQV